MLCLLVTAECCVALQVIDQKPQYLEMAGNLIPIAKTEDQLNIVFRAFHENRMAFPVRIRDPTREPTARLTFMREPREARGQTPVCSVVVTLPEFSPADSATDVAQTKTCESLSPFSLSPSFSPSAFAGFFSRGGQIHIGVARVLSGMHFFPQKKLTTSFLVVALDTSRTQAKTK